MKAIEDSDYKPGEEIYLALDTAASEFYESGNYNLSKEDRVLSSEEMVDYYDELINKYPIFSIEDGLYEDDWDGWKKLNDKFGNHTQIVGDDLFVTQEKYLERGINNKCANSILIKFNQVGTITETLQTIKTAQSNNFSCVISHRSGETEDTTIADLSVGTSSGQIKTGAPARSERVAKYNRLLKIENELGSGTNYFGKSILKK